MELFVDDIVKQLSRRTLGAIAGTAVVLGGILAIVLIDGQPDESESGQLYRQRLSAADRIEVRRLVSDSRELKRILRDWPYEVTSIGLWDSSLVRRHPVLLRFLTIARVRVVPRAEKIMAQWPYIGKLRPCRRYWIPSVVTGLREVVVFVGIPESVVAAIVPERYNRITSWNVRPRRDSPCV